MSEALLNGIGSIEHNFVGPHNSDEVEIYLKRSVLLPGASLRQHSHNYDHVGTCAKGSAMVKGLGDVWVHVSARESVLMPAGVAHEVATAEGCVWYCVHAHDGDDETKVDDALIAHQAPV